MRHTGDVRTHGCCARRKQPPQIGSMSNWVYETYSRNHPLYSYHYHLDVENKSVASRPVS